MDLESTAPFFETPCITCSFLPRCQLNQAKMISVASFNTNTQNLLCSLEMVIRQFGEENPHLAVKEGKNESTGLAAWFVSNCNTYSGREDFVEKLKKYIPVDVYGSTSCSNFTCQDDHGDCMGMVNRTYKVGFDYNKRHFIFLNVL